APPGAVLVLDGSLLLGRGLALDLTVHLSVRAETLARRTPPEDRWTLPAFSRYEEEAAPERDADVVVRVDDPRHPALLLDR
ncbi:MAG TPA: uridine kinase, partial [Cellulomonas sp.]